MKSRIGVAIVALCVLAVAMGAAFSNKAGAIQKATPPVATDATYEVSPVQAERRQFVRDMDARLGGFRVIGSTGDYKLWVNQDAWNKLSNNDRELFAFHALAYASWLPRHAELDDQSIGVFDLATQAAIGTLDNSGYTSM